MKYVTLSILVAATAASLPACSKDDEKDAPTSGQTEAIHLGDGTPASVTFADIYIVSDTKTDLVDLAWNGEDLWVVGYGDNRVHLGTGVAFSQGSWKTYLDPAAQHFMHKPPAIAMGANGTWGVCGDNDNSQNDPRTGSANYFMGPALFTADLTIFPKPTPGGLGSHYDMLHNTSFCRGIAHVEANWFWVFNGELGSLDKYNFAQPHDPGADDHSDGEIYRYVEGQVKGVDGLPSHVIYDPSDRFLYVADTGNHRIVRLDTTQGTLGAPLTRQHEPLAKNGVMEGASLEVVVPPGLLDSPVGIEVKNGLIYVTDAATSRFYAFDKTGREVRRLDTGLPPRSLAGFAFGPDDKIWFVDRLAGKVVQIQPN